MRASALFQWLSLAASLAAVAIWFHERAIASDLQSRSEALGQQEGHLSRLRADRDRLREQLLAAATESSAVPDVAIEREPGRSAVPAVPARFATGEWTPATDWANEGRATPRSTLSTLLWAAAGGDLAALQTVLEFDEATRLKAQGWLNSLPPATRSLYATPEDLVASVTIKNIAPTAAQLTWFHQPDADHAIVGVLLAGAVSPVPAPTPVVEPAAGGAPPSLVSQNPNQLAVLNLRRTPDGWRVIVPLAAIDRMAKVLRTTTDR
jgi:hypothetical protein